MILSAKDVRATLVTQTSMNVWTKGLVHNVAETLDSLEKSLSRQSVHLAQALKEKNDALERLTSSMEETRQIAATTVRQAQEIKQRNAVLASRDKEIERYTVQRDALNARVEQLSAELAALRPPEPKFKVGQLVIRKLYGTCYRLTEYRDPTPAGNTYWGESIGTDVISGRLWERDLRELTAQEKGE